jgi:segregation and condensation protein A
VARSPKRLSAVPASAAALATVAEATPAPGFSVALQNFEGPFDLLLSLIGKHELDITEISLSRVTDEFISYLRGLDAAEELDQATEFLVVAATTRNSVAWSSSSAASSPRR